MIILQILWFAVLNFHVLANSVECVVSHGLVFMLIEFQTILHESKSVCHHASCITMHPHYHSIIAPLPKGERGSDGTKCERLWIRQKKVVRKSGIKFEESSRTAALLFQKYKIQYHYAVILAWGQKLKCWYISNDSIIIAKKLVILI